MRLGRIPRLGLVLAGLLGLLIARLAQLQILEHEEWLTAARRSRTQHRSLPFHRGRILDLRGRVLAEDQRSYDLMFQYRDFRRGHPAGQLLEAYLLLGEMYSLDAVMDQAEPMARVLFGLRPQDLEPLSPGKRGDLLFYLRGLAGLSSWSRTKEVARWMEEGTRSFGEAFPEAWSRLPRRLQEAQRDLDRLEALLGLEPGELLPTLEDNRLALELRIRQQALREAAGRAFGLSPREVYETVRPTARASAVSRPAAAPAPADSAWQAARGDFLQALAVRWSLPDLPAEREALAELLAGAAEEEHSVLLQRLTRLLQQVEQHAPQDQAGLRRPLVKEVHAGRLFLLQSDIPYEAVDLLAQDPTAWPGLFAEENPTRAYPNSVVPHVVGTVRVAATEDITEYQDLREEYDQLARLLYRNPAQEDRYRRLRQRLWRQVIRPGETRGRTGMEWVLEDELRGQRGYVEVLHAGEEGARPLELDFAPPRNGEDARLSLDVELTRAAQAAVRRGYELAREVALTKPEVRHRAEVIAGLERPRAAFVLLDLRTGGVPVLTTEPSYDAESFRRRYAELQEDPAHPLRHRVLGGNFGAAETPYPGSTFKLVAAAEALAQDPGNWAKTFTCQGSWAPPGATRPLQCEAHHGELSLRDAIARSCNVYFYKLGEELGYEALYARASQLGFGRRTGIDLIGRRDEQGLDPNGGLEPLGANQLVPPAGAGGDRARRDGPLPLGVTAPLRLAIGQTWVVASPLQMARLYGWIATGRLWRPRLLLEAGGRPTLPEYEIPEYPDEQRRVLEVALQDVVGAVHGTAFDPELVRLGVAGKTGTAQVSGSSPFGPALVHAWFVGYFPVDRPRYAFAVLCENVGLHGGDVSSVILREFLLSSEAAALLVE